MVLDIGSRALDGGPGVNDDAGLAWVDPVESFSSEGILTNGNNVTDQTEPHQQNQTHDPAEPGSEDNACPRIQFLSQNVQKSSENTSVLLERNRDADIIMVQEIFWGHIKDIVSNTDRNGQPYHGTTAHPNFVCYGAGEKSRVAVYVHKRWARHRITTLDHILKHDDVTGITLHMNAETLTVINVYNDPRTHAAVDRLLEVSQRLPTVQVLAGDMNAHHEMWDPRRPQTAHRSQAAEKIIDLASYELSLALANSAGHATWQSNNRRLDQQVLDLVWLSEGVLPQASPIQVDLDGRHRSDHAVLRWSLEANTQHSGDPTIGRGSAQAAKYIFDVKTGLEEIQADIPQFQTREDAIRAAEAIDRLLQDAWDQHAQVPDISKKAKSWWNVDCAVRARAIRHLRASARAATAGERDQIREQIRETQNDLRRTVRQAKRTHFRTIIEKTASHKIWDLVSWTEARRNRAQAVLTDSDGQPIEDDEALAQALNHQYAPPGEDQGEGGTPVIEMEQRPERDFPAISPSEIRDCLLTASNKSAPGPDRCNWLWLKNILTGEIVIWVAQLFQACVQYAVYPVLFKQSVTVVIPKPNKERYDKPKAFRPIVLLNCIAKLFEKVIAKRMQYEGQKYGILHPCQYGGTAQHNTVDAALHLVHNIHQAWKHNRNSSVLLFDIAQYYPSIIHDSMVTTLRLQGFNSMLCEFMTEYLKDRVTTYVFNGRTLPPQGSEVGLGQGSALSPVLSGLYLAPTIHKHNPTDTKHALGTTLQFFVDDGLIHVASPEQHDLTVPGDQLQINNAVLAHTFAGLARDLQNIGLYVEPDKFEIMHFRKGHEPWTADEPLGPSIALRTPTRGRRIAVREVKPAAVIRYLGFMLDPKLTWRQHIRICVNKACSTVNAIRMLGNSTSGLTPRDKRTLYISNVVPVMLYGAAVWWQPGWKGKKWIAKELQQAQTKAARWITGAFRTTPVGAMEMAAGLVPIRYQVDRLMKNAGLRTRTLHKGHPTRALLPDYWKTNRWNITPAHSPMKRVRAQAKNPLFGIEPIGRSYNENFAVLHEENRPGCRVVDQFHSQIHLDTVGPKKHSEEFKDWMKKTFWPQLADVTSNANALVLYTDGSRISNKNDASIASGAAWLVLRGATHVTSGKIPCGKSTPYDAEMFALAYGVKAAVKKAKAATSELHIFTDNQGALNNVFKTDTKSSQMLTIMTCKHIRRFLTGRPDRNVYLHWCPGHVDVPGNEFVDKLAGQAAKSAVQPDFISLGEAKRTHKEQMIHKWKKTAIKRSYTGKKFPFRVSQHSDLVLPNKRNWFIRKSATNHSLMARLIRAISGHAPIGEYRQRFNIDGAVKCACGHEVETRDHILYQCPLWIREEVYTNDEQPTGDHPPPPPGPRIVTALPEEETEYETDEDRLPPQHRFMGPDPLLRFLQMNPMAFSFEWAKMVENKDAIPFEERTLHMPFFLFKAHTDLKRRKWTEWRQKHPHECHSKFVWDAPTVARRLHQWFADRRRGEG